jgi:hypothetical protein
MANKTLQLFRNASLYASHEAALNALKTQLESAADGSPVLARYTTTVEEGGVQKTVERTLLGIAGKTAGQYEIFDNQGGNDAIRKAIDALDYAGYTLRESEVFATVTETNGVIAATGKNLSGIKLAGYTVGGDDSGKIATTDTLGEALGKLQGQINGMDKAADVQNGKVVTTVAEADGKVSETKANVKDLQLGGYSKDTDATGSIDSTDTINAAFSKIENAIAANTVASDDKTITIDKTGGDTDLSVNIDNATLVKNNTNGTISSALKVYKYNADETAALGANVNEAYQLQAGGTTKGTAIGDVIKIYKDSSLVNIYLGHVDDKLKNADAQGESSDTVITNGTGDTALVYVVQLANGKYKLAAVNVESFLQESEFANGLQVNNHVVSVKVDSTSESFLTVDAGGVKLSGVQAAITSAIEGLDVTNDTAVAGQYVAAIEETDGIVAVKARANVSEAVLNNYTKGSTGTAVAATDTINQAIGKLENQIGNAGAASKTTLTEVAADATIPATGAPKIVVTKSTKTDGHYNYDVTAQDMASAAVLAAEIAARKAVDGQDGQTYAANTSANYISDATSLNNADVKLDAALKNANEAMLTGVAAGNGIHVSEKSGKSQTITAVAVTDDPIIEVTANGIGTKDTAVWDCGTYQ